MPIRKILICVLTGMLCFGFFSPKAADAAQTPQEFVKEFYEWYIIDIPACLPPENGKAPPSMCWTGLSG